MLPLNNRIAAEALGTCFLLVAVIGSGIMAERLSMGNMGLALLANSVATGGALVCLIYALGPISGAHFNPAVSIADAMRGGLPWHHVPAYAAAQIAGAIGGTAIANVMFGLAPISFSHHARAGAPILLGEFVATFGLLAVIWGCSKHRATVTPIAVAAYIVGAYWFTSSTSFANPAVTIARALTDTFAGIRPADIAGFIAVQLTGAVAATLVLSWLIPIPKTEAQEVLVPHGF